MNSKSIYKGLFQKLYICTSYGDGEINSKGHNKVIHVSGVK